MEGSHSVWTNVEVETGLFLLKKHDFLRSEENVILNNFQHLRCNGVHGSRIFRHM